MSVLSGILYKHSSKKSKSSDKKDFSSKIKYLSLLYKIIRSKKDYYTSKGQAKNFFD